MTREKLIALRDVQKQKDSVDDILKDARAQFEKAIETNVTRQKELSTQIDNLKAEITEEAKSDFTADPDKKKTRDGGVKIQTGKLIEYDAAKALSYAKEKDMFLALDKKAFEKVADGLGLDFVKSVPVVKVTFPTAGIVLEDV